MPRKDSVPSRQGICRCVRAQRPKLCADARRQSSPPQLKGPSRERETLRLPRTAQDSDRRNRQSIASGRLGLERAVSDRIERVGPPWTDENRRGFFLEGPVEGRRRPSRAAEKRRRRCMAAQGRPYTSAQDPSRAAKGSGVDGPYRTAQDCRGPS
eukprot:CAMPEP_0206841150 /NCGR_PEP_ID=MMETSP0975-20121206/22302_1 /ASSEMBLY_ACC=CAM_ASM_000399 /TAXON_ID=483370 /ORGANISM="non described non described, Strain CCMP2097" /LENGTH=154 /DNA_ID=CAMNT_0054383649 /DNA_START=380 /DNA_END=841 /DNA_ORIENTATION=-